MRASDCLSTATGTPYIKTAIIYIYIYIYIYIRGCCYVCRYINTHSIYIYIYIYIYILLRIHVTVLFDQLQSTHVSLRTWAYAAE
jgi:hypothetical protein